MNLSCSPGTNLSHLHVLKVIPNCNLQVSWDLEYFLLMVHEEGNQACGKQLIQVFLLCTAQDTAGKRLDQLEKFSTTSVDKDVGFISLLSTLQWHQILQYQLPSMVT